MAAKKRKSPSINHRGVMHIAHGNVNPKTHHESRWQEHRSGLPETERPKYVGRRLWHGQPASIFASRRRDGHTGEPQLYYVQTDATRMRMTGDSDILGRCGLACGFL